MKRVVHVLLDDLDGKETGPGGETVSFALDGIEYEIDLNSRNAFKLREAITPYAAAGVKLGRTDRAGTVGPTAKEREERKEYRARVAEWVRKTKGITPADRGRLKEEWYREYEDHQKAAAIAAIVGPPPKQRRPAKSVPPAAFSATEEPQSTTRRRRSAANA